MGVQILLQLAVHHVRGQQQREFAEFGEHAAIAHGEIGRGIDHFDFVGFVKKFLGDAGGGALSGEALDRVLLLARCTAH